MYVENKRGYRGRTAAVEARRDALYFVVPHYASERIENEDLANRLVHLHNGISGATVIFSQNISGADVIDIVRSYD